MALGCECGRHGELGVVVGGMLHAVIPADKRSSSVSCTVVCFPQHMSCDMLRPCN